MNRPFSAFVALLVLLASAMLAVSSADRSTSVRPAASPTAQRPAGRGAIYVLVLPESESEAAADEPEFPSYATGCGLDRATGELYGCEVYLESYANADWRTTRSAMTPAAIELADADATILGDAEPMDCRSHYDPAYDRAVYGTAASAAKSGRMLPAVRWSEVEFERLLGLFDALSGSGAETEAVAPATTKKDELQGPRQTSLLPARCLPAVERLASNARALWLGLQNRTLQLAGVADEADDASPTPMDWIEYAELIDELAPTDVVEVDAAVNEKSVRSSGWMRHFAASSLHHAGLWLQDAALQLDGALPAREARQIAPDAR